MPLRLHLTVVRSRPLFRLGLRRFCCHDACTSWCFALVRCFTRAENGELTALLLPQFPLLSRENAAYPRRRTAFIQTRYSLVLALLAKPHFRAGRRASWCVLPP